MIKSALLIALLASCAIDDLSTDTQDIVGGTPTVARPEVGKFLPVGNDLNPCAATLISPTTFLTSARCIGYAPLFAAGGQNQIKWEDRSGSYPTRVFSLGAYESGNANDLAVGEIFAPTTFTPAAIAYVKPFLSQTVTEIGYECSAGVGYNCTDGIDGRTELSGTWGSHPQLQQPADEGGTLFLGSPAQTGPIVAFALPNGLYADPIAYRDQILSLSAALQPGAGLSYRTYLHGTGWQSARRNGAATGPGTSVEGLQIWTDHAEPQTSTERVCYSVLAGGAWGPRVCDGELAGQAQTYQTSTPIQVLKLDYQVNGRDWPTKYRVYSHASGWGAWYTNNQVAGVFGDNIEAIQIQPQAQVVVVPPDGGGLN